ncbi:MAG: YkgJ family cysteine cluster protein [Candidatus Aenigmarchaeota archaeon]|nr:YkgJ family cysteine cluster protein [Candidatus Aenigmarchaeota archaeon]
MKCGKCCTSLTIGELSSKDIIRIIQKYPHAEKHIKKNLVYYRGSNILRSSKYLTNMQFSTPGCVFYNAKERLCTIYNHRPDLCREYPFIDKTLAHEKCPHIKEQQDKLL